MKITTKTGDKGETSLFGGRRVSKASAFIELVGELDELQAVVGWCGVEGGRMVAGREVREPGGMAAGVGEAGRVGGEHGASNGKLSPVKLLKKIVDDLYRMMSIVGFEMKCPRNIQPIGEEDVEFLEKEMAKYEEAVGNLAAFVRPGGSSELAARLHIARTVCRRVERRMVGVIRGEAGGMKERAGEGMETNAVAGKYGNSVRESLATGDYEVKHVPGNVLTDQTNPDVTKFMLKYLNRLSDLLFVLAYAN